MKILFFYTELAQYFLSCVNTLVEKTNSEVHIVKWPVNKEAPFDFQFSKKIKIYERNIFNKRSLIELTEEISPDIIYCSGWMDNDYLFVAKKFKGRIPVIVGFDNKWNGNVKQQLGSLLNKITIHKYFSHCWIPGKPQEKFARKLGFTEKNILLGFYSGDYDLFHRYYLKYRDQKKKNFPHKFIFSARYYEFKGITDLWKAFIDLQKDNLNDWELWCLGAGDIKPIEHPKIKHFGFIQPEKIERFISECGVFVLPSRFEPWGVAVHEFAAAGFPIICSDEVGAASEFLEFNENGFIFKAGNTTDFKNTMIKLISFNNEQLFMMGEKSAQLAKRITPEKWVETLMSVVK